MQSWVNHGLAVELLSEVRPSASHQSSGKNSALCQVTQDHRHTPAYSACSQWFLRLPCFLRKEVIRVLELIMATHAHVYYNRSQTDT
jgi:hypothetical protein